MPKVSVLLTSFNHRKYIKEAIQSVLDQTFQDFELIICDDASTDGSAEIIKEYNDPRIKLHFRNKNARGILIEVLEKKLPSGEYIAIHHSDDVWESDKLQRQVDFLDNNQGFGAVFTDATPIEENGSELINASNFYFKIFTQKNRNRFEWLRYFFLTGNCLCHPSVLIRKSCYDECGLYKLGLAQSADYEMWIKLCSKYEIYVLKEKLIKFRIRDNDANESGGRPEAHLRWSFEFYLSRKVFLCLTASDLFNVFPELKHLNRGEETVKEYLLAQACLLPETHKQTKLFGLELLFSLLESENLRKKVKELYNFDYNNFVSLTGSDDFFGVLPGETVGVCFDLGEGFNEFNYKKIKKTSAKHFKAWIAIPPGCKKIRIDPAKDCVVFEKFFFKGVLEDNNKVDLQYSFSDFAYVNSFLILKTLEPTIIFDISDACSLKALDLEWWEGNAQHALMSLCREAELDFRKWIKIRFPVLRHLYRAVTFRIDWISVLKNYWMFFKRSLSKAHCPLCLSRAGYDPLPKHYRDQALKYGYKYFGQGEMTALNTYSCKNCGASDRERLYALWISEQFQKKILPRETKVLHFAPEIALKEFLLKKNFEVYNTCDLMAPDVDFKEDIMELSFKDQSYDFIICSHVLEHVCDDRKALKEIYRVLRPGGMAILMAPICLSITMSDEAPDEKNFTERWRRFGQDDHVRLYAQADFKKRILEAGFEIQTTDINKLGKEVFQSLGLKTSSILYVGLKVN